METCLGQQLQAVCSNLQGAVKRTPLGLPHHTELEVGHHGRVEAQGSQATLKKEWQSPFSRCPHTESAEAGLLTSLDPWHVPDGTNIGCWDHQLASPVLSPPMCPLRTAAKIWVGYRSGLG